MNAYTEDHVITLFKGSQRDRSGSYEGQIAALLAVINNKSLTGQGWHLDPCMPNGVSPFEIVETPGGEFKYESRYFLRVAYRNDTGISPNPAMFPGILRKINDLCPRPAYGSWTLTDVDGTPYEVSDDENVMGNAADELGYSSVGIPPDFESYFAHLYGLEAHIERVRKAVSLGITTGWRKRVHSALIGPPGCGKSDICQTLKDMLGEDAVMEFDGTATTAAGAIKKVTGPDTEVLPRIIVVEEIEKAPEESMRFLLGVMDMRGEIRKTTARGDIQRNMKCMVIATVNDFHLFSKLQAGALASRFMNKIHFSEPSRETLALILTREVKDVAGNFQWIEPTLDYCDEHNISDPREVISICLCGQDDLLDNTYQAELEATSRQANPRRD